MEGRKFGISRPGQISERRKIPTRTTGSLTKIPFLDNYGCEVHSLIRCINKKISLLTLYIHCCVQEKISVQIFNQFFILLAVKKV